MEQTKNVIFYKTYGKNHGYTLVFLHGYLESSEIWDNFASLFSDEYFVICIDLPGHGRSLSDTEELTVELMGEAVIEVTDKLGTGRFHLVGHSMGGYVALAIAEKYYDKLNSLVLFHSTCFADTEEKRTNRNREIELVRTGKKDLIINTSVPRLFASENLIDMSDKVEAVKKIASQTKEAGIISALNAMKARPDRSHIVSKIKLPFLLVGGMKDNHIPIETMEKMKMLSPLIRLVYLENSGHIGFIEEQEMAAKELKRFFDANFECL